MRLNRLFAGLLGLTLLAGGATGCVLRAHGGGRVAYVVDTSPPPPRAVYVDARPGQVWVDGYWYWTGYDWAWNDGYYERERPGYFYVQGTWVTSGGRHHWKPGYWNRGQARGNGHWQHGGNGGYVHRPNRGGVQVREHAPARGGTKVKVKVKVKEKPGKTTIKVREHR
jgi:hypothetical protein